jgi:hypothetical protein
LSRSSDEAGVPMLIIYPSPLTNLSSR